MATYRVSYTVDLEADSPLLAAAYAYGILRSDDPARFAPIFEVKPWLSISEGGATGGCCLAGPGDEIELKI